MSTCAAIANHLKRHGSKVPEHSKPFLQPHLEIMVRNVTQVRSLGAEYGNVELSPYMQSLLSACPTVGVRETAHAAVAASV